MLNIQIDLPRAVHSSNMHSMPSHVLALLLVQQPALFLSQVLLPLLARPCYLPHLMFLQAGAGRDRLAFE
jgi:hypothetical protein